VDSSSPSRGRWATSLWRAVFRASSALLALGPTPTAAQFLTEPSVRWLSIATERFDIHYPEEMRAWAEPMARRIESIASYVEATVGNRPPARVNVIVDDPSNLSNGFAIPFLEGPVIFMWPTAPAPGLTFGTHRGWSELLAVHEYTHVAHLTFPPRNPRERILWSLLPVRIGPVARKAPAWVVEGYATLVEGRLTGSGRPPSAGRAAVLRVLALDGKLPPYHRLDASDGFPGGALRYLVGSAFLEWLEARRGDSSLVHLWRRMSARQERNFSAAFSGVFGAPPEDLYGKFVVVLTARALAVQDSLERAGLFEGELVQRLRGATGEPALSPDGRRIALVLRPPGAKPRLVVWSTEPEPDSARQARLRRALELDPLDVAPYDSFPAPRRPLATLYPVAGRSHEFPRWMPDGVHLLVVRDEPTADGRMRPDLFLWNTRSGQLRRLTRGAALRYADPAPDGRQAAAVQCLAGICSLVLVELASGAVRTLAAGAPDVTWHRPRWSPDGRWIAASLQRGGRWSAALVDPASGQVRSLGAPDVVQHSPTFTSQGDIVVVTEEGGLPNLALLSSRDSSRRFLTRVLGGVLAPESDRAKEAIYFLALHSDGYDLRRVSLAQAMSALVKLDPTLAPVAPPGATAGIDFTDTNPLPKPYRFGPRLWRLLPASSFGPDGSAVAAMLANLDPVGRASLVAQAGLVTPHGWQGASLQGVLRALPLRLQVALWSLRRTKNERAPDLAGRPPGSVGYRGVGAIVETTRNFSLASLAVRAGAATGRWEVSDSSSLARLQGFAAAEAEFLVPWRTVLWRLRLAATEEVGQTGGLHWGRSSLGGRLALEQQSWVLGIEGRYGIATAAAASSNSGVEQFTLGGAPVLYLDPLFLSQYWPREAVPLGLAVGWRAGAVRLHWNMGPLGAYADWLSTDAEHWRWRRVLGLEAAATVSGMSFARLPGVELRWGAGRSLDEPGRPWRAYSTVLYRP
jgi:hypothetical protein